jgi:hypothetical protein
MVFLSQLSGEGRQNEAFDGAYDPGLAISVETLNELNLDQKHGYKKLAGDNVLLSFKTYVRKYYQPSRQCAANFFLDRVPFVQWITHYNIKEDLVKDLVAGITIGVVHIPQ